jgi:intracellular sulfur oxidation DsrE/DsrF family protein
MMFFQIPAAILSAQQMNKKDSLVNRITDSLVKVASEKYSETIRDSITKKVRDSLKWDRLKSTAIFPVIKNSEWSAAFPVSPVTENADPKMKYKLLFNMTAWSKDSASLRKINEGFAEIGRIINLHVAAGVPKENLELAIVVHGGALNAFLKNDLYRKKFKTDNPNLDILKQFEALNTKLIACGQAELFFNILGEDMLPEVKTAYSARVAISTYQLRGYVLYNIESDK